MAYTHGLCQEASVPCHMDLSIELLEYPYNVSTGLPQSKIQNKERGKLQDLL